MVNPLDNQLVKRWRELQERYPENPPAKFGQLNQISDAVYRREILGKDGFVLGLCHIDADAHSIFNVVDEADRYRGLK